MSIATKTLEPQKSANTTLFGSDFKHVSVVLSGICLVLALIAFGYDTYRNFAEKEANRPKANLEGMVGAIRNYQKQRNVFPQTWGDLHTAGIWKSPPVMDNRERNGFLVSTFGSQNYLYLLTRVRADLITLWAIPTGPQRGDSKSIFITLGPNSMRYWSGPGVISNPQPVPEASDLAAQGFMEQTQRSKAVNP